eukprot:jgi/Bigna1/141377/aug1.62_g16085
MYYMLIIICDKGDNNNLLAWGLFGNNYAGQFKSLSKQLFNAAFDHTDKDDSGYLEQKEVEEMVIQMMLEEGIETMKTETAGLPRDQSTLCWERMQRDLIEKIESAEIRAHRAKEILNFLDQDGDGRLSRTEVLGAFSPEFLEECKVSELGEMEFCERMDRYINVLKAIGLLDWSKVEEIKKVPFEDAETARKTTLAMIKLLRQAAANRS